jgi:hypothetical protein
MNENSDKTYYATGDLDQIQPFTDDLNNIKNVKEYYKLCHTIMFPERIILKINKRLKNEEDKQKLQGLKADIFNKKIDVIETCKKYGIKIVYKMEDVKTNLNLCYFKYRCKRVNNHIYGKIQKPKDSVMIGDIKYYTTQKLTCTSHYSKQGKRLFTNYEYEIVEIGDKTFTVYDRFDDNKIELDYSMMKLFKLPYAQTINSVQGLSFDEAITIFDCNTPYVSREHVWVALTRCRDMSNLQVFCHSKSEVEALTQSKLKQYFEMKIDGYKKQDNKAKRTYDEKDFVDYTWIVNEYNRNKYCQVCNQKYVLGICDGQVESDITCDRINNDMAHTKDNIRLCCHTCNCIRGNNY